MRNPILWILGLAFAGTVAFGGYWGAMHFFGMQPMGEHDMEAVHEQIEHAHKHMDPTYTCPMHPQVKSDKPGNCPICGMKLVKAKQSETPAKQEPRVLYWYDPMRPEQHFDVPGKSPFMDMELVPKYAEEAGGIGSVTIDPRVVQNLGIRTASVERGEISKAVRVAGSVMANENRIEVVQNRTAGWVEKLHVRAVNDPVRKGQILAEIYAPELLAAQEEFLLAQRMAAQDARNQSLVEAAHGRLRLLGLGEGQIAHLQTSGQPTRRVSVYAPINGIVMELGVREGAQLSPGMSLFSLVDLSSVWIIAEVPEAQAAQLSAGFPVMATVAALPRTGFGGKVDYVYPEVNPETRTLRLRAVFPNPKLLLKPGMFAEVVLGQSELRSALLAPSEAVIRTGTRATVILAEGEGRFRPVEVQTGGEREGKTEILAGVEEGQQVVVSGQFLIDSEANLRGALTRLAPPKDETPAGSMEEMKGTDEMKDMAGMEGMKGIDGMKDMEGVEDRESMEMEKTP
ncbi:MAG: efflux RND transporter periplasmic adaptor subunit [Nevskiales bacterium]